MSRRWTVNLEKALALYEQARKEGQPARVAQFEEQISKTMQDTAQDLAAILTQQEPATTGLDKLTTALTEGLTFFATQGSKVQAEIEHINAGHKKLEAQLRRQAEQEKTSARLNEYVGREIFCFADIECFTGRSLRRNAEPQSNSCSPRILDEMAPRNLCHRSSKLLKSQPQKTKRAAKTSENEICFADLTVNNLHDCLKPVNK